MTRAKPGEMHFVRINEYIKDREPITDTDVVLWYSSPAHHEPRSEVVHAFADHSKLRRVFGEQPQTGLEDGVARMVGWAREHGARGAREFTGIEVTERLPRSWLGEAAARRD